MEENSREVGDGKLLQVYRRIIICYDVETLMICYCFVLL